MSDFSMGTILGQGFPQAQVHIEFIAQVPNLRELFRKASLPFFVVIVLTVCWSSDKECDHLLTLINKETGLVIGDVKNLPMFYCNTCGNICQHVSAWIIFSTFLFSSYYFCLNFFHSLYSFLAQRHLWILLFSRNTTISVFQILLNN